MKKYAILSAFALMLCSIESSHAQSCDNTSVNLDKTKEKQAKNSGCTPSACRGAKTKFGEAKVISDLRLSLIDLKSRMEKYTDVNFSARSYDIHNIVGETDEESLEIIGKEIAIMEQELTEKLQLTFPKMTVSAIRLDRSLTSEIDWKSCRIRYKCEAGLKSDYIMRNKRVIVSTSIAVSFLVLSISGVLSYFVQYQRTIAAIHTIFGFLFVLASLFHLKNNLGSLKMYFTNKGNRIFLIVLVMACTMVFVLSIKDTPPISLIMDWGAKVKAKQKTKSGRYIIY